MIERASPVTIARRAAALAGGDPIGSDGIGKDGIQQHPPEPVLDQLPLALEAEFALLGSADYLL
jgi:hypothetical protein